MHKKNGIEVIISLKKKRKRKKKLRNSEYIIEVALDAMDVKL
jgi:hypothetical protein